MPTTLAVLEKQGLLDLDSDKRDQLWEKSFGQVYDAIRRVNQEVGELATSAFETIEDQIIIQKNISAADDAEPAKLPETAEKKPD